VAGLLGLPGRHMTGYRLFAERQGDFPPEVSLTIDPQESAHIGLPFIQEGL